MVKVTISGRFIKPDGSVGEQNPFEQDIKATDELLNTTQQLSTGHLVVGEMQKQFDAEVAQFDEQLRAPGSGYTLDRYQEDIRNAGVKVKNSFFQQRLSDGLNGNLVDQEFDSYMDSKFQSASNQARTTASHKSREEFFEAYKQLYNKAAAAPQDMVAQYMGQIENLLGDAGASGAFSTDEVGHMRTKASGEIVKSRVKGLIESDPDAAMDLLSTSGSGLGLSGEELESFKKDAAGASADLKATAETDEQFKLRYEKQLQMQEYEKKREQASRNEYLAINLMQDKEKFSPAQYETLRQDIELARQNRSAQNESDKALLGRAEQARESRSSAALGEFSDAEIDRIIQLDVEAVEKNTGAPISLSQLAGISGQLRGRSSTHLTRSLQTALNSGDSEQIAEALGAVAYLATRNPAALAGLPKDSRAPMSAAIHAMNQLPDDQRTPERITEIYQQAQSAFSDGAQRALKKVGKEAAAFEKRFNRQFDVNSKEFTDAANGIVLSITQETDPGAALSDVEGLSKGTSKELVSALHNTLKKMYMESGGEVRSDMLYAAAVEEVKRNAGTIPFSADRKVYPNAPGKLFQNEEGATAAFSAINKSIVDATGVADIDSRLAYRPTGTVEQADADGNPYQVYSVTETLPDGREVPVMFNGVPLTLKVNADTLNTAVQEQAKIDRIDSAVELLRRNIEERNKLIDVPESPEVQQVGGIVFGAKGVGPQPDVQASTEQLEAQQATDVESIQRAEIARDYAKRDRAAAIFRVAPKVETSNPLTMSQKSANKAGIRDLAKVADPVKISEKDKQIHDRIMRQVDKLNSEANQALSNAQQLQAEYDRLVRLGSPQSDTEINTLQTVAKNATAGLPAQLSETANDVILLSTMPGLSRNQAQTKLSDVQRDAYKQVGTFFTAAGANLSPSEGRTLRAVGRQLGKVTEAPEGATKVVELLAEKVADVLASQTTIKGKDKIIDAIKKSPEIYRYLSATTKDREFKENYRGDRRQRLTKELNRLHSRWKSMSDVETEEGRKLWKRKTEIEKELSELKDEKKFSAAKDDDNRAKINDLQDAWLSILPNLSAEQVAEGNKITEKINKLQFEKANNKQIDGLLQDMARILGLKLNKRPPTKKKKTGRKSGFLGRGR